MTEPMPTHLATPSIVPFPAADAAAVLARRSAYEVASLTHYEAQQVYGPDAGETRIAFARQQELAAPLVCDSTAPMALVKADILAAGDLFARALLPRLLIHCLDNAVLDIPPTLPWWERVLQDPVPYVSMTALHVAQVYVSCESWDDSQAVRRQLWAELRLGRLSIPSQIAR